MSLLYDRLVQEGALDGFGIEDTRSVPVVDIRSVQKMIAGQRVDLRDMPNVAPPWPLAFFEWGTSSAQAGAMMFGLEEDEVPEEEWEAYGSPRWVVALAGFAYINGEVSGPGAVRMYGVSEDGALGFDGDRVLIGKGSRDDGPGQLPEYLGVLLAISLTHCKNVELRAVDADPKRVRSARKKGRILHRHHVIEIDPMRKVLRDEGRSDEVGIRQSLHICRGHFKDYRQRGLFGSQKHRGIYWWGQQARGTPSAGTVSADYEVMA